MTVSLLRASVTDWWFLNHIENAYVTDWWFLNHIDNAARTGTIGKPYPVLTPFPSRFLQELLVTALRKDPLPNVGSYHERKANKDYRLEEVQECLCLEGREWVRHRDGRPHYLKRNDLDPMAKGWYDFVCRSILPTTNRSELTVERAVLIHSIIIGENINVEEIIADQIYKFVYKTD
ncbi:hypothetical protein PIB30_049622 [Stylosanthes scabra]|uniref:Putative plant transposon protein domain-containing protein n=1 Tax=Stylosanthes scabra TaxID=79078 RepID=A0ABU6ZG50_9FABA|nr:hypothetical protein [Stylosanthes scabra]